MSTELDKKVLSCFLRKGVVYIRSYARATTGVWIGHGPVFTASPDDVATLGQHLHDAVAYSIHGVAHPPQDQRREAAKPMLEAAGVKSWQSLARGAKHVGIRAVGDRITFTPSARYHEKGGMKLDDQAIEAVADSASLGVLLQQAFARCE